MKLIKPMAVDDTALLASNVAEDDYPVWDNATSYAAEDMVIVIGTTHRVYKSVQAANAGNDPTTDSGIWWVDVSATNRWKAFDERIADRVENANSITYSILTSSLVRGMAFFGLEAVTVRVEVYNSADPVVKIFDQTINVAGSELVADWYEYYFEDFTLSTEALVLDFPAYAGYQIDITIDNGTGTARVGQIVMGNTYELGVTTDGTNVGFQDFSIKEQDDFGYPNLVQRGSSDEVEFQFSAPTTGVQRIKKILNDIRATPIVFFADSDTEQFGTTIFGFYTDFDIPLKTNKSFCTLQVKGLV